jgi:hypothetical protein
MYSSTRLFEVPSADCFSVAESYIVRQVGAEVQLSIYIDVVWTKSSMLKWAIDSSTATETTKFLGAFVDEMKKVSLGFVIIVISWSVICMRYTVCIPLLCSRVCH